MSNSAPPPQPPALLDLERDGARHHAAAFGPEALAAHAPGSPRCRRPGARLGGDGGLERLLGPADAIAAAILGSGSRPVRALLLDKNESTNWSLSWHQDRVIALRERREADGFTGWTLKSGVPHVEPPFHILELMLTLPNPSRRCRRLSLDSRLNRNLTWHLPATAGV